MASVPGRPFFAAIHFSAPVELAASELEQPIQVPLTILFSKRDEVVHWPACIDRTSPKTVHVEIGSTHVGMGIDPDVWSLAAQALAGML